jgi:serine protease Do
MSRHSQIRTRWAKAGIMTLGLAVAAAIGSSLQASQAATARQGPEEAFDPPEPSRGALGPDFSELVKRVTPAVVNISISGTTGPPERSPVPFRGPGNTPFEEFFRRYFEDGALDAPEPRELRASGSGVIVAPEGCVVTNYHVVEHADTITVILHDGTRRAATIRGVDPKTDLALLQIDASAPLPYVRFGDSDHAEVGDWVIAVGNPFGLGGSVTAGIISARGRDLQAGPYDDFLQIDAPINRGNSGGPLFNTAGEIIGINTAIYSPTGGNVGIGFAIPSSLAKGVVASLENEGHVDRGWLGVHIQPVTEDIAENLELEALRGALVAQVGPESPAAQAGLEPGDVILSFGDTEIETVRDLSRAVAATPADTKVRARIWRNGEKTLRVQVAGAPAEAVVADAQDGAHPAHLGVQLADLTPEIRGRYRLEDEATGVMIVGVEPNGPAAQQGLRAGDVIVQVGARAVEHADQVVELVRDAAEAKRNAVLLLVARGEDSRFVAVPLERA